MSGLRVLRVYHAAGVDAARERALLAAGVDLTVVVPERWPGAMSVQDVPTRPLAVRRPGDVNRHLYADPELLRRVIRDVRPDVLDVHEEPVSLAARQWLRVAGTVPVVMYTAQNVDKRWPPPFAEYERAALHRVRAFYPCSRQAASVLRGKGFAGPVRVLPLGVDADLHFPGDQQLPETEVVLGLVGRLVPEKGVRDAVRVLAHLAQTRPARLVVVGEGPEAEPAGRLAAELGVADRVQWRPWLPAAELAALYRTMHVVLVPSRATVRWVEQFGRVVAEAQANGAVVAAYDSGSVQEVLGGRGVLVADSDTAGLAAAVADLVASPEQWTALRAESLRTPPASWQQVAALQVQLYDEALSTPTARPRRASAATRAAAVAEFGPAAATPAGLRPFALPVLRDRGVLQQALGALVDGVTRQR